VGLGVVLVATVLVAAIATAPTTDDDCHECTEMFGRVFSPLLFLIAVLNVLFWAAAVIGGGVIRRASSGRGP